MYIELGVAYLCLCERAFPSSVAVQYLEALQQEFNTVYGDQVATASRPYQFIAFGAAWERVLRSAPVTRSDADRQTCARARRTARVVAHAAVQTITFKKPSERSRTCAHNRSG